MTYTCEYCEKELANISSLNFHMKNAKYCLKIQENMKKDEDDLNVNNICEGCKTQFSTLFNLNKHRNKCVHISIKQIYIGDIDRLKKENNELKKQIGDQKTYYEKRISSLEKTNRKLLKDKDQHIERIVKNKDKILERLAKKISTINIQNNNNNIQNNNNSITINNLQPTTVDWVSNRLGSMVKEDLLTANAFGAYLSNTYIKDNTILSDISRNIIQYINQDGKIIKSNLYNYLSSLFKIMYSTVDKHSKELQKIKKYEDSRIIINNLNTTIKKIAKKEPITSIGHKLQKYHLFKVIIERMTTTSQEDEDSLQTIIDDAFKEIENGYDNDSELENEIRRIENKEEFETVNLYIKSEKMFKDVIKIKDKNKYIDPDDGAKIDIRDINFDKKINEDGTFSDEDSISLGYSL